MDELAHEDFCREYLSQSRPIRTVDAGCHHCGYIYCIDIASMTRLNVGYACTGQRSLYIVERKQ